MLLIIKAHCHASSFETLITYIAERAMRPYCWFDLISIYQARPSLTLKTAPVLVLHTEVVNRPSHLPEK